MKSRLFLACILIAFSVALNALASSCPGCETAGMLNGRYWAMLDNPQKIAYVTGLQEGVKAACLKRFFTVQGIDAASNVHALDSFTCQTCTVGDLSSDLDLFYQVAANRGIPVSFALTACLKHFRGASAAEIDAYMASLRKVFNETD